MVKNKTAETDTCMLLLKKKIENFFQLTHQMFLIMFVLYTALLYCGNRDIKTYIVNEQTGRTQGGLT